MRVDQSGIYGACLFDHDHGNGPALHRQMQSDVMTVLDNRVNEAVNQDPLTVLNAGRHAGESFTARVCRESGVANHFDLRVRNDGTEFSGAADAADIQQRSGGKLPGGTLREFDKYASGGIVKRVWSRH